METLPLDVQVLILSYLPSDGICRVGRVSKALLRASRNQSLWERICAARGLQEGSLAKYRHMVSDRGRLFDQQQVLWAGQRMKAAASFFTPDDKERLGELAVLFKQLRLAAEHQLSHALPEMMSNVSITKRDLGEFLEIMIKFDFHVPGGNSIPMMHRIHEEQDCYTSHVMQTETNPPARLIDISDFGHTVDKAALLRLRDMGGFNGVLSLYDFSLKLFSCGYAADIAQEFLQDHKMTLFQE